MKDAAAEQMFFSGIIYLYSLTDARMTNSSFTNLRLFRKLCGEHNLDKVVLATTKAEITPTKDVAIRSNDLTKPGGFWAPFVAAGSKVQNLENTFTSATNLVREVLALNHKPFIPRIQQEMMDGIEPGLTEAGRVINDQIETLKKEHEEEMNALRSESELAIKKSRSTSIQLCMMERARLTLTPQIIYR
jgi:hypothetical protein